MLKIISEVRRKLCPIGACGLAPVVVVGTDTYGAVDPVKVMKIVENYK
ncbi:NAD(P)H-dependent oxidoreductase subunit E [bacterium]|nr:NAD(P)H-dependent oxidoreductase subunit E [bacterium]